MDPEAALGLGDTAFDPSAFGAGFMSGGVGDLGTSAATATSGGNTTGNITFGAGSSGGMSTQMMLLIAAGIAALVFLKK